MNRFFLAALISAILVGNAYARNDCLPADSGGCTGDIIQLNSSLNMRFHSVNYGDVFWEFWNKTSCTLKPFKYRVEYDGKVYDDNGNLVPGREKQEFTLKYPLPSHDWLIDDAARGVIGGGAANPSVTILSPLECEQENKK